MVAKATGLVCHENLCLVEQAVLSAIDSLVGRETDNV